MADETTKPSAWEVLSKIDCTKHVEKKNGLTYLSWAWAWGITKENLADANYQVHEYDGKPYLADEHLGYMVQTSVTIRGETIPMHLPVLDHKNKALKLGEATMFNINTAIMRCLTKNLAMFGLGHYIYAGEDLPQAAVEQAEAQRVRKHIASSKTADDLVRCKAKLDELDIPELSDLYDAKLQELNS